jgi:hypothetical protein
MRRSLMAYLGKCLNCMRNMHMYCTTFMCTCVCVYVFIFEISAKDAWPPLAGCNSLVVIDIRAHQATSRLFSTQHACAVGAAYSMLGSTRSRVLVGSWCACVHERCVNITKPLVCMPGLRFTNKCRQRMSRGESIGHGHSHGHGQCHGHCHGHGHVDGSASVSQDQNARKIKMKKFSYFLPRSVGKGDKDKVRKAKSPSVSQRRWSDNHFPT